MEKCQQLYNRLQEDIKPIVIPDQDFSEEGMGMFCLQMMMKQVLIKEREEEDVFVEQFEEIGNHWHTFDDKTKKTIWLYFDLFVKLSEKYTKEQTQNLVLDTKNIDIESKMSEVSSLLEGKLGMKMTAGMEDMIGIIAKEVQKELHSGNGDMKGIIKNVMEKVVSQFQDKIESGEINIDELKQSAEKLMKQIGNPAGLMGSMMGQGPAKSREEKRRERRERLRKKLAAKQKS